MTENNPERSVAETDPTSMARTDAPTISATPNGPLIVNGAPLYRRRAVKSEHGEPLAWETTEQLETRGRYALCRCGQSNRKPFCDGTHAAIGFAADDVAAGSYGDRSSTLGGTGIVVRDDRSICVHAGFCGSRVTNVWQQVPQTSESTVRAQVIAMVERCPSGALTYRFGGDTAGDAGSDTGSDVEPLFPQAIAVIDDGPLWVTGGVPITMPDGRSLEVRNRVTLCRCGASANKPLCDGTHASIGFSDH